MPSIKLSRRLERLEAEISPPTKIVNLQIIWVDSDGSKTKGELFRIVTYPKARKRHR